MLKILYLFGDNMKYLTLLLLFTLHLTAEEFTITLPKGGEITYTEDAIIRKSEDGTPLYTLAKTPNIKHFSPPSDSTLFDKNYNPINAIIGENNELLQFDWWRCAYDENGRLIQKIRGKEIFIFTYNDSNQLIHAIHPPYEVFFNYEGDQRTQKTVYKNGNYLYEETYFLDIATYDEEQNLKELFIPSDTYYPFILPTAIELSGNLYLPTCDEQGNIQELLSPNKEVSHKYNYTLFGKVSIDKEDIYNPFRFSSKREEKELGLIYFGKRYYDPDLLRWISPDPLGSLQSENLYQYCFNDPLQFFDPNGEIVFSFPIWGAAMTAGEFAFKFVVTGVAALFTYKAIEDSNTQLEEIEKEKEKERERAIMEARKEKEGKQKDGCPKNNQAQNSQFEGACKEIERKLGKKLTNKEVRQLHEAISKQGYGYHDIVEEGYWMFKWKAQSICYKRLLNQL